MADVAGFLGGVAQQRTIDRKLKANESRIGLDERRVTLAERQGEFDRQQALAETVQAHLTATAEEGEKLITLAQQAREKGGDPRAFRSSLEALAKNMSQLPRGSVIGQRLLARFDALNQGLPGPAQAAQAAGEAEAAGMLSKAEALQGAGLPEASAMESAGFKTPKPTSPLGKLLFDRALVAQQFGEDSPQTAALDEAIEGGGETPDLTDVAGVRKEFTKLSSDFIDTQASYGRIASSPETAAGDVALVFNFMKMLDPTSVVREGEFAMAASAAGLPDRLVQLAERVDKGTRLTSEQRADFRNVAAAVYRDQLSEHRQRELVFKELARRQKMDPAQVVVDFVSPRLGADVPPPPDSNDPPRISTQQEFEALPSGAEFIWTEGDSETRARKP